MNPGAEPVVGSISARTHARAAHLLNTEVSLVPCPATAPQRLLQSESGLRQALLAWPNFSCRQSHMCHYKSVKFEGKMPESKVSLAVPCHQHSPRCTLATACTPGIARHSDGTDGIARVKRQKLLSPFLLSASKLRKLVLGKSVIFLRSMSFRNSYIIPRNTLRDNFLTSSQTNKCRH